MTDINRDQPVQSAQSRAENEPYSELLSILNTEVYIEPGIRFKEQFYPNLKALVKALEHHDDFIDIQYISVKGIEHNLEVKEKYPGRDHTYTNYRLALFEAIANANSFEDALGNIKDQIPEFTKKFKEL